VEVAKKLCLGQTNWFFVPEWRLIVWAQKNGAYIFDQRGESILMEKR